jgi:hypothetical protein
LFTLGTTAIAALSTVSTIAGMNSTSLLVLNFYATALAAGKISGTGEATLGFGWFSGAVTLTLLISKVLTGYASGPGVVAATDSICCTKN